MISETGPTAQVVALGVAHGPHAAAYVPEAHAAGAHQRHPGVGRHPPELVAHAVGVRAAEDHRAARADLGRGGQLLDEAGVADAEQDEVRRLVEGVQVGQAGPAGHLGVRRVDQVDPLEAGRLQGLAHHPVAEAARTRARPDERDAARGEGAREGVGQAGVLRNLFARIDFLSWIAAFAACQPGMPQTPPPPWVAELAL